MMNSFNKPATNDMPSFNDSMPLPFGPKDMPSFSDKPTQKPGSFNIDDIVKKIDAKIAELEEQERLEQLEKSKVKVENKEFKDVVEPMVQSTTSENKFEYTNEVTDDQFFDDFFNDED